MPPTKHSEYGPSGMAAKLLCLGKHLATKGMENGSSAAADRGTECHDFAEIWFQAALDGTSDVKPPEFKEDWQLDCTRDMVQHALDKHNEMAIFGDVTVLLEEQVDLSMYKAGKDNVDFSKVYGTCDVLMYCKETKTLCVLDYKTGVGVVVDPEQNVQLMMYALGAMSLFPSEVENVVIAVSQPRVHKELQTWTTNHDALVTWCVDELKPGIEAMSKPGAPLTPGKKQCQWCPVAGKCKAQKDKYLGMFDDHKAKVESTPAGQQVLSDQDINDLLLVTPDIAQWVKQVQGLAQGIMEDGGELPNFKLVRGRGSRGWTSEEDAEKFLKGQKLKEKERHTYKLLTPPQAEKALKENLKRTITKNNFDKLVKKSEGKVTWALKTDKRDAVVINKPGMMIDLDDLI